jgi:hypothetical protein
MLTPLRIRTHSPLMWDERYTLFIRSVEFMSLARHVTGSLLLMDSAVLTALVDRWRPETHTFHLACGETTVTLQDITMTLGLPLDDTLVCGPVSLGGGGMWSGLLSAFDPPTWPQTRRTRRHPVSTPIGSQLTLTPTRRTLKTQSFRGTIGIFFCIWMMSYTFLF